jgi:hypothetical protein
MRRIEIILAIVIVVTAFAVTRGPLAHEPVLVAIVAAAAYAIAIAIDRATLARHLRRPVPQLVTLIFLAAVCKRVRRVRLRTDDGFAVWFDDAIEMRPPDELEQPVLDELRWRLRRWAGNVVTLRSSKVEAMARVQLDIGEDLARIEIRYAD